MAKKDKKTDFSSLLKPGASKGAKAPSTNAAIKAIHGEKTKRVTLDIPLSLHRKIKLHCFEEGVTMKKYLLDLARENLG